MAMGKFQKGPAGVFGDGSVHVGRAASSMWFIMNLDQNRLIFYKIMQSSPQDANAKDR